MRRAASIALLALAGILFPLGVVAGWAAGTVYDSNTFSQRAVDLLGSAAVRRELAQRLTEQLVLSGNQQASNFRPALQLAVEAAVDTDTFKSIFRTAVRRTHSALLQGAGASSGLDLADSVAIISSTLQLPSDAKPSASGGASLGSSLTDVTERLSRLGVWKLNNEVDQIVAVALIGAVLAAAGAIAVSTDRRRTVGALGWIIVADGAVIVAGLAVLVWWVARRFSDPQLADAVSGALQRGTDDLRVQGFWIAGYGVVIAAAARGGTTRFTPRVVYERVRGWVERRRRTTGGTVLVSVLALLIGLIFVQEPLGNLELLIVLGGLWLSYLGVCELLGLVRSVAARRERGRAGRWRRVALASVAVIVLVGLVTAGLVLSTGRASRRAAAAGVPRCNGDESLCDLRLDQAMFLGAHNAMSSSLYSGYLFAEQTGTITRQLEAGVRALLIDTHYGVQSSSRFPGSETPLVLTDRAAELSQPVGEDVDPAIADRAARLAARSPKAADATRDIYLCHNYCELGAVPFSSALAELKNFLDVHPDEVVIVDIQDATTPADTAAAIESAGLADRAATLERGVPLPTLGELIESKHNLLVFAEQGGPGAPDWYQPAYRWFQETPYTFKSTADFNCLPNRGPADAPLFLVNHWVNESPPDPSVAANVNGRDVVEKRIQQCIGERGRLPNVVAVDFAERGGLAAVLKGINGASLREVRRAKPSVGGSLATTTTVPRPTPTVLIGDAANASAPPIPDGTVITHLTGGDPDAFCAAIPPAVRAVVAWAETILGDGPAQAGITDLVYGPVLVQDLGPYVRAAPVELAQRMQPLLARGQAAVVALKALGVSDTDVAKLAALATADLGPVDAPDGVTVRAQLVEEIEKRVDADRLEQAAIVFGAGQPDPATQLDLGSVSDQAAQASGFNCPSITITI
jgi:hypothetical protein